MSEKIDKKVRKMTDTITKDIKFRAVDLLHGIKQSWTTSEKRRFAAWLQDPKPGEWNDDYQAPLQPIQKVFIAGVLVGGVVGVMLCVLVGLVLNA